MLDTRVRNCGVTSYKKKVQKNPHTGYRQQLQLPEWKQRHARTLAHFVYALD